MTPASRRPVASSSAFHFPEDVDVVEGTLLAWNSAPDDAEVTFRGGDDLLSAFIGLQSASPAEMADFLTVYGVPELCQHGRPDRHRDAGRPGGRLSPKQQAQSIYCPPSHLEDGRPCLASEDLRKAARAFAAARAAAEHLAARQLPGSVVWSDMTRLWVAGTLRVDADWREGRRELACWLTGLLDECGVKPVASWDDPRLRVVPEADGLFGTLALLLARDIGQGDRFRCDVCGTPVDRVRPPKQDERVYCSKPACKREQQRLNQARWRAKRRAERKDV